MNPERIPKKASEYKAKSLKKRRMKVKPEQVNKPKPGEKEENAHISFSLKSVIDQREKKADDFPVRENRNSL